VSEAPAVELMDARLAFGARVLWDELDVSVRSGEFIAVLGPNGSGKSSLLRVLLGLQRLSGGSARVCGRPVRAGNREVGYIPQQKSFDRGMTLRGRDLVGFGIDGHRWGVGAFGSGARKRAAIIDQALDAVDARRFADAPLGRLSGGEQQRLRIAQALVSDPKLLLCDEPLLSLDPASQIRTAQLIDARRRTAGTAVVFVTHEINPILPIVDRVLYLVDGRFRIGAPREVMTSESLSELYRTQVDVFEVRGRLVVAGTGDYIDAFGHASADPHPGLAQ
jgi:zinc/manganese transport system ATP-binding protein